MSRGTGGPPPGRHDAAESDATGTDPDAAESDATGTDPDAAESDATGTDPDAVEPDSTDADPDAAEPDATATARAIVRALAAQGVRHVVLCPGSRSAPLAYALASADAVGWLTLHVRADERSAAFLALGLTRADDDAARRPAAVVTTSGTAVANLHPAVLEASHGGRPLVVVTADRPHELRGTGANQTTDQVGFFGTAVRWSADLPAGPGSGVGAQVARAVAAARGLRSGHPGPVHLNVGLREPLTPRGDWHPGPPPLPAPAVADLWPNEPSSVAAGTVALGVGPRTVVVAGDGAGPGAAALAEAAGWPLLAEPTSGARHGPCAVAAYRVLLGVPGLGDRVERVVVVGRPTLSRPVARLLARTDVAIVVVAPHGGPWTDVSGAAAHVCAGVRLEPAGGGSDDAWLGRWRRADHAAREALSARLETSPLDGLGVAAVVDEALAVGPAGTGATAPTLVVGASMAVRDLDLVAQPPPAPDGSRVLANRGLSGIDGTVSTAVGVALASGRPVRALVGDLTFLHDLAGLAVGRLEQEPDLQVVVVNDDGGAIFATIEHGAPRWSASFERVFATPHGADLGALCAGYGVRHTRVTDRAGLRRAIDQPVSGRSVVEAVVDRRTLRADRALLTDQVRHAAEAALAAADAPARPRADD